MTSAGGQRSALTFEPWGAVGNDGLWSGFTINVRTPPQNFTVLPATNDQHIYIPVADDYQRINRTDCRASRDWGESSLGVLWKRNLGVRYCDTSIGSQNLGVDFERKHFNVSQANFAMPMQAADIVTIMPPKPTSNSTLDSSVHSEAKTHDRSLGAVTGIVLGAIVVAMLIASLAWLCWRRRSGHEVEEPAAMEAQRATNGSARPKIMGQAVDELLACHGLSEVDLAKMAMAWGLEGRSTAGVYELR
ncbi:hypothetical protein K458DRAFT_392164 [Lentithecium fluviatile CBS 122367]|uniref:Peptidase A1 domain-containing protein n=1 Tax=Lentithecium fluviatile CBS 122367 TaxID=1168545 RepID=A0A6G1ITU5_9PLEO|nr:hypothetical protein K458DRAFT_392164 [Lentithecium fluviatile CBS 122367]